MTATTATTTEPAGAQPGATAPELLTRFAEAAHKSLAAAPEAHGTLGPRVRVALDIADVTLRLPQGNLAVGVSIDGASVGAIFLTVEQYTRLVGEHPEDRCGRCGGPNITWHAPSPLWNEVMRGGDINGPWQYDEIICPICFAQLAEEAGIADRWRLDAEHVRVPLQTVTPSGRVWNAETWLWDDEPADAAGGAR